MNFIIINIQTHRFLKFLTFIIVTHINFHCISETSKPFVNIHSAYSIEILSKCLYLVHCYECSVPSCLCCVYVKQEQLIYIVYMQQDIAKAFVAAESAFPILVYNITLGKMKLGLSQQSLRA